MRTYIADDLDCWLDPRFIDPEEAEIFFTTLYQELCWRQDKIRMFGKWVTIPRLQTFMADSGITYTYSGLTLADNPWHPIVAEIKKRVEKYTDTSFNAVLINLYRDGSDSMGWHRDNEPELGDNPKIASISLGSTRRFLLKSTTDQRHELCLSSGSLLWMGDQVQKHWQHSVPKTKKATSPRINLTFRDMKI